MVTRLKPKVRVVKSSKNGEGEEAGLPEGADLEEMMGEPSELRTVQAVGGAAEVLAQSSKPLSLSYEDPRKLRKNDKNWHVHPDSQVRALRGAMSAVGWAGAILVNETTGNVLDGHARIDEAMTRGDKEVPVLKGRWTEAQENFILLTHDSIGGLAEVDDARLAELLPQVETDNAALQNLFLELESQVQVETSDGSQAQTGPNYNYRQKNSPEIAAYLTMVIAVRQHQAIEGAIEQMRVKRLLGRGDALTAICQEWLETNQSEASDGEDELAIEAAMAAAAEADLQAAPSRPLTPVADVHKLRQGE